MAGTLTAVQKLVALGKHEKALAGLVEVWRASRSAAVGSLLRELGAAIDVPFGSPTAAELAKLPRGQARFQACLTSMRRLRTDDAQFAQVLAVAADAAPDARLGEIGLRLLFDFNARWAPRELAAGLFFASCDSELVARFEKVEATLHEKLAALLGARPGRIGQPLEDAALIEPIRQALLAQAGALGQSFDGQLRQAIEEQAARAQARAQRRARVPAQTWARPRLGALPRLAASHLLDPGATTSTRTVAIPTADLPTLLQRWRKTRDPELAAQLEVLDAAQRKALRASAKDDLNRVWLSRAAARDVLATGWLAETLFKDLTLVDAPYFAFEMDEPPPGADGDALALNPDYVRTRFRTLLERFDELEKLLPDPRVASVLTGFLIRASIPDVKDDGLFARLVQAITLAGDPRQLPALSQALTQLPWKRASDRSFFAAALPAAIEALAAIRGAPVTEKPRADGPSPIQTADELMTAVLKAPDDDRPRLVLADWLQDRGAPRGEFITLQVNAAKAKPSDEAVRRMNSLERTHRAQWLGPLARVFTGCVWERGFLVEAALQQNARAPAKVWEEAYAHPVLELVRRIELGNGNARHFAGFLEGGRMLSLDESCIPDTAQRLLGRKRKTP